MQAKKLGREMSAEKVNGAEKSARGVLVFKVFHVWLGPMTRYGMVQLLQNTRSLHSLERHLEASLPASDHHLKLQCRLLS